MRVRVCPVLFFLAALGAAQAPRNVGPVRIPTLQIPQAMLRRMIRDSGRIFAGTVTNIQHVQESIPITRVTFRIDEAIRGVRKGQIIQISEWGGLWQAGEQYQIGERVKRIGIQTAGLGARIFRSAHKQFGSCRANCSLYREEPGSCTIRSNSNRVFVLFRESCICVGWPTAVAKAHRKFGALIGTSEDVP